MFRYLLLDQKVSPKIKATLTNAQIPKTKFTERKKGPVWVGGISISNYYLIE